MDRLGFESFVLLWPLTYLGAVVMWFYVYGKARGWWYCYHALLLAVCGAHLAIVLTRARELWPLLVVQSWQLGGFAIYALGILPFTVLIVAAPLFRESIPRTRRNTASRTGPPTIAPSSDEATSRSGSRRPPSPPGSPRGSAGGAGS